jgi:DNA-binding NarL/FixJ family response regulator
VRLEVKDSTTPSGRWRELVEDSEGVVRSVLAPKADGGPCPEAPSPPFTLRESQVAVLLGRGLTDRAIAQALAISPKTAEKHVGAVLRKTGTTSRTAAVVRALERGWLPEEFPPHP